MNKIKYTFYSLVAMLFVSVSLNAQCEYTAVATDSFGDGWDGATIEVTINGGTPIVLFSGFTTGAGPVVETFSANAGDVVQIDYIPGSFDGEHDFTITDCNGNVIVAGNGSDFDGPAGSTQPIFTHNAVGLLAASCTHNLEKTDSFGDGWNGNTVTINYDGAPYSLQTLPDGGAADCFMEVEGGTVVDVIFNADGSFVGEVGYRWINNMGSEEFNVPQGSAFDGQTNTFTAICPMPCTFTCPTDVPSSVTLGPGECEYAFTFTIQVSGFCEVLTDNVIEDFTGPFAPENVHFTQNFNVGPAPTDCGSLSETTITLTTSDPMFFGGVNDCVFFGSVAEFAVPTAGVATFDWSVVNTDPSMTDFFGYSVNLDGDNNILTAAYLQNNTILLNNANGASGTTSVTLDAGDLLGFIASTFNGTGGPLTATITNFSFTEIAVIPEGPLTVTEYVPVGLDNEVSYCVTTTDDLDGDGVNDEECCEYELDVLSYPFPVTSLACNDLVNVSVNEDCQVEVNADIFLEGGPYACYTVDYSVFISGIPGNVNGQSLSLATGTYQVTVQDNETGNTCWGEMLVEDKLAPTMECDCPVGGTTPAGTVFNNFSEDLSPADESTDNMDDACLNFGGGAPIGNGHFYDEFAFEFTTTGMYSIAQTTDWGDGQMSYYSQPFNPDDVCANLLGGSSDVNGFDPEVNANFTAGVTYYFVFTSWGAGTVGGYDVDVTGPGDMVLAQGIYAEECIVNCIADLGIVPPVVMDNCDNFTLLAPNDSFSGGDGCNDVLTRSWALADQNGTIVQTCVQEFIIEPLTFADITLPPALVELPCGNGTDPEDIQAFFDNPLTTDIPLSPNCQLDVVENNEGTPFAYPHYFVTGCNGQQHPQAVDNSVCNIFATYSDQDIPACGVGCGGNVKVIRTWTLLDWCTGALTNFVQIIKAIDQEAPTFTVNNVTVSTDPWGCAANFTLPIPWELHDNCDENPTYSVQGPAGVIIVGSPYDYSALNVPKGVHTFTYNAVDCCGNVGTQTITVSVLDQAAPVPVAKQNIIIGLTSSGSAGNGTAKLFASSVDNGSHDGCTAVKIEIRRETDPCNFPGNTTYNADGHPQDGNPLVDTDGGQFVKFCCADLTDVDNNGVPFGMVKVWMRVFDDGDMNGVFGSAGDNYNEIWVDVRVEDKLAPALVCPPDVTIDCDQDHTDLDLTGEAQAYATCDGLAVAYTDTPFLNACNEGFIQRRWFLAGNPFGTFCIQRITIEREDPPFNGVISWPQDMTVNCANANPGEPSWTAGPCDVIGYDVDSDTFLFEDGACFKILNEYTVIDWCQYEPNSPFWDGEGIWTHVQIIKVIDNVAPEIDCENTMFPVNDNNDVDGDGNLCENRAVMLTNTAVDGGGDCMSEWLKWQITIDVWGNNTVDYVFSSFVPPFSPFYVAPTGSNEEVKVTIPEDIESSMSNHKVTWQVTDGCGNHSSCSNTFMVVDKKAPTPYCVSLSSALMDQSGEVELWACDFNIGSFDNCTDQENLRYTFSSTPPEDDPNFDEEIGCSSMIFDCDDLPVAEVTMYVWDEKGNFDFCVVVLDLVDNFDACGGGAPRADIAGVIQTEAGEGVEEVILDLNTSILELQEEMTGETGAYAFYNNLMDYDYSILPTKDGDYMNGVSTLDLVMIQRHILNLASFTSPYQVIAADINYDAKVSAADLVDLRKLILGVTTELPNNSSWRFVDAAQEFAEATNPWPFDEVIAIEELSHDMMENNFVGVKIGDVNGSVESNLTANSSEVRSANTLTITVAEQSVVAGQTVEVTVNSADFADVYGYQFTMELNGLAYTGVTGGAVSMNASNVGVLKSNLVTVSYSNSAAVTAGAEEGIFTMTFTAEKAGQLSDMMNITSRATQAEAYVGAGLEIQDIELTIRTENGEEVSDNYVLNQNEPNPFKDQTTVSFYAPVNASATITVYDVTGKVVMVRDMDAVKGHNEVNFTQSELGTSGVLYYQLESGDFVATKKMIIIE